MGLKPVLWVPNLWTRRAPFQTIQIFIYFTWRWYNFIFSLYSRYQRSILLNTLREMLQSLHCRQDELPFQTSQSFYCISHDGVIISYIPCILDIRDYWTHWGGCFKVCSLAQWGSSGMKLVQMCRWASSYSPYKCILEYGKSIRINVYTIMEDNKKCSLFPFKLSCLMQKIISTVKSWIINWFFIRKQQYNLER